MNVMDGFERPTPNSARATRAYLVDRNALEAAVEKALEELPRWTLERKVDGDIHAIRRSRLFRFKDDVTVNLASQDTGTEASFESASRAGKGDLGQNLRNLRELLGAINENLGR